MRNYKVPDFNLPPSRAGTTEEAFVAWKKKAGRLSEGSSPGDGAPAWLYQSTFEPDERLYNGALLGSPSSIICPNYYTLMETLIVPDAQLNLDPIMSWRGGLAVEVFLPDPSWTVFPRQQTQNAMQNRLDIILGQGNESDRTTVLSGYSTQHEMGINLIVDRESLAYLELMQGKFGRRTRLNLYARPVAINRDDPLSGWLDVGTINFDNPRSLVGLEETGMLIEWLVTARDSGQITRVLPPTVAATTPKAEPPGDESVITPPEIKEEAPYKTGSEHSARGPPEPTSLHEAQTSRNKYRAAFEGVYSADLLYTGNENIMKEYMLDESGELLESYGTVVKRRIINHYFPRVQDQSWEKPT